MKLLWSAAVPHSHSKANRKKEIHQMKFAVRDFKNFKSGLGKLE